MVKVITTGTKKPKYIWMDQIWRCGDCGTTVEFEATDNEDITYQDDQRDGIYLSAHCPVCFKRTVFHRAK